MDGTQWASIPLKGGGACSACPYTLQTDYEPQASRSSWLDHLGCWCQPRLCASSPLAFGIHPSRQQHAQRYSTLQALVLMGSLGARLVVRGNATQVSMTAGVIGRGSGNPREPAFRQMY